MRRELHFARADKVFGLGRLSKCDVQPGNSEPRVSLNKYQYTHPAVNPGDIDPMLKLNYRPNDKLV